MQPQNDLLNIRGPNLIKFRLPKSPESGACAEAPFHGPGAERREFPKAGCNQEEQEGFTYPKLGSKVIVPGLFFS